MIKILHICKLGINYLYIKKYFHWKFLNGKKNNDYTENNREEG